MTHLVILSSPRSGSHMLRSMLSAEPIFVDIGSPSIPWESIPPPPEGNYKSFKKFYKTQISANPGKIVLSNLKLLGAEEVAGLRAALETGGCFLYLYRNNLLAQAASVALASTYNCYYKKAPFGAKATLSRHDIEVYINRWKQERTTIDKILPPQSYIDLEYELLTPESVSEAVHTLIGRKIITKLPSTPKTAPPLEEYVTNLTDFKNCDYMRHK